ncbi:MAG: serine hydrolase domain-containing protein [Hyphomicrobiaceae bacterium]
MTVKPTSAASSLLTRAEPGALGFDARRLARIREALEREVAEQRIPGAVVGVARHGQLAFLEGIGYRDKATSASLWADAIFSIASMTKPMTSVAIMILHEEGRLLLTDPVSKFLPQLAGMKVAKSPVSDVLETVPAGREMTVQDLLRHTSGLTYRERGPSAAHKLYPGSSITAAVTYAKDDFLKELAKAPLLYQPGTTWEYGFSTDILGFIVEAVSGKTLGAFLKERLWGPLGMADTGFVVPQSSAGRYARALPNDPLTGQPQAVHHATGDVMKWESGGGGAVSTAADYLRFTQMLLNGGVLGDTRILGRKTVELMRTDHLGPEIVNRITTMEPSCNGYGFGLGFAVRQQAGVAGMLGSAGDYYWSGVYGTYFWIDPAEQLTTVFMAAAPGIMRLRYRQLVRALVLQALTD